MNLFSRCSAAMYSPCASLNMFLMRSTTLSVPAGVSSPTSPVWKKPSLSAQPASQPSAVVHCILLIYSHCLRALLVHNLPAAN